MEVTVHTVVKNEDVWVWYAIQSVLPFVEKVLVFDTGSEDRTVNLIKSIKSKKIIFEEKGAVDRKGLVALRQEQLERTKTDWFLILDGDEIWPRTELEKLLLSAASSDKKIVAIYNEVRNCIGDVWHYLPADAGNYHIGNRSGNLNIRLIRKTESLKISGEYPLEVYGDENGPIQKQPDNLVYSEAWYLHTSFLQRSSRSSDKVSGSFGRKRIWQSGINLKKNQLPEVFGLSVQNGVDFLKKRGVIYDVTAKILTPAISLRRKLK